MCSALRQALIMGGSRGVGYSVALKFAMSGYNVVIMSRNSDNLAKSLHNLKEKSNNVSINGFVCDVSSEKSIKDGLKCIDNKLGAIEVLVNCAAINSDKLLMSASNAFINDIIETNLIGTIFMCKSILKHMIRQRKGSIVNIGSIIGLKGNIGQSIYSASKAGLIGFTKSLAKEVASKGITVNLIAPGFVRTDMTSNIIEPKHEQLIPLKRIASPEEIAEAVYFMANASYITGEVLIVDGGLHLVL